MNYLVDRTAKATHTPSHELQFIAYQKPGIQQDANSQRRVHIHAMKVSAQRSRLLSMKRLDNFRVVTSDQMDRRLSREQTTQKVC